MKFPRLTVRRLMVVVAICGVLFWGYRLRRLSALYRQEVERCEHGFMARGIICYFPSSQLTSEENQKRRHAYIEWLNKSGVYYKELKSKYERAARYPWLSVSPDPPEPPMNW